MPLRFLRVRRDEYRDPLRSELIHLDAAVLSSGFLAFATSPTGEFYGLAFLLGR